MAKDAYYFSHDCNARNDPKVLAMRSVYGAQGYGWFWMIVEIMREQEDYRIKKDKFIWNTLAMQLNCQKDEIENFIKNCIDDFELFESDQDYIWSESLLRRMEIKDEKRKKKSEAGKKGALARWGNKKEKVKETQTNSEEKQKNSGDNGSAITEDSSAIAQNGKRKESKRKESKVKESKEEESKTSAPIKKIFDLYNQICTSLPSARKLSDSRRRHIKARWEEEKDISVFEKVFKKAEASSFMAGKNNRGWVANLDWIVKNNTNFNKVLEGKYDDKEGDGSGEYTSYNRPKSKSNQEEALKQKYTGY